MAWFFLSLPCLADPPAESPSTINNSDNSGFFSWQSASLPGRDVFSRPVFLLVNSLAFLAASLAFEASIILSIIFLISDGFSSIHCSNLLRLVDSITGLTSEDTSLSFVWLENLGSGNFTDIIHVNPSRASSPVILPEFFTFLFM